MGKLDFSNHLENSEDYIITGIYNISKFFLDGKFFKRKNTFVDPNDFKNPLKGKKGYIKELTHNGLFINYYVEGKNENIFRIGRGFVISKITDKALYSTEYKDCTAIIGIGKDKETGKNIGFLTHQWPDRIFAEKNNSKKDFSEGLNNIIQELKNRCIEGTIDITLLGGRNDDDFENYRKILQLVDNIVQEKLGFQLQVSAGPSLTNGITSSSKNIIVDTENRRVLLFKEYNSPNENIDFYVQDTEKALKQLFQENERYIKYWTDIILNNKNIDDLFISKVKELINDLKPEIFEYFDKIELKKELIPILLKQITNSKPKTIKLENNKASLIIMLVSNNGLVKMNTELETKSSSSQIL